MPKPHKSLTSLQNVVGLNVTSLDELIDRLPCHAVAVTWHRAHQHQSGDDGRLQALYYCTQAVFRTVVSVMLSDFLSGPRDADTCRKLARALHKPSDGNWVEALNLLNKALQSRSEPCVVPEALQWLTQKPVKTAQRALITARNKAQHGGQAPGPASRLAREDELVKHLSQVLHALDWLADYKLIRLANVQRSLNGTVGRVWTYMGRDGNPRPQRIQCSGDLADETLYLVHEEREVALLMEPWLRVLDQGDGEALFLWQGWGNNGAMQWRLEETSHVVDSVDKPHDLFEGKRNLKNLEQWLLHGSQENIWRSRWTIEQGPGLATSSGLPSNPTQASMPLSPAQRRARHIHDGPEPVSGSRRNWKWLVPVVAGTAVLAIILAATTLGTWALYDRIRPQVAKVLDGKMRMRLVPAGTFKMGSPPSEKGRIAKMEKQRKVTLTRDIWVQETEVTVEQWRQVMGRDPSYTRNCGQDCPVEMVSWWDSLVFANRLSKKEGLKTCYRLRGCNDLSYAGAGCVNEGGQHTGWCGTGLQMEKKRRVLVCEGVSFKGLDCEGYRLPTEAEWEYAARAGTTSPTYAVNGKLGKIAWIGSMFEDITFKKRVCWEPGTKQMVGLKRPNNFGLYDMIGNVAEWTWGVDQDAPENAQVDPVAEGIKGDMHTSRVFRGGGACWDKPELQRAASRMSSLAHNRSRAVGLRLVRTDQ